jgi:hypothetical protein
MEKTMNKWTQWYDSLSPSTKQYLSTQAVWHDRDIFKFAVIAFILGIFVGMAA